jgi:hypothetical protein
MSDIKKLKKRADKAWDRRKLYDQTLLDIYDYIMPFRQSAGLQVGQRPEGAKRVDKVFDATAPGAAFRFAGTLQMDLTPIFQPFFSLEAGPEWPEGDDKKSVTESLQAITNLVAGVFSAGSFHQKAHEMYLDLFAGQGAMLIMPGEGKVIARFRTVPISEIALEEGPDGEIWGIVWRRKFPADEIEALWPKGTFGETLRKAMSSDAADDIEVHQYTRYNPKTELWDLTVWTNKCSDTDAAIHIEHLRTSPWLTPRFFVVPGEAYGRGPAHLALPFVKTVNKVQELKLKAAAISLYGIWTRRNDSTFNPSTAKFEPRAFWAVGSNGGPLGPTLQKLDVPGNFNLSDVVLRDEREQMKIALLDNALPPDVGTPKSATEIAERIKRLSQDKAGVLGRLTLEIIKPAVERVIDLLYDKNKIVHKIPIDQLLTQVRVVAPIAAGEQIGKVTPVVNWLQMVGALTGDPKVALGVSRAQKLLPQIGRWFGVEEQYIASDAEIVKLLQGAAQAAQQQQAAEAEAAAPHDQPPPNGADLWS